MYHPPYVCVPQSGHHIFKKILGPPDYDTGKKPKNVMNLRQILNNFLFKQIY